MDDLCGERRGRQRPPDPRPSGRGVPTGIGHQPDHGREDRERELKTLVVFAPIAALVSAACGTAVAPSTGGNAQGQRAYQKCYSCHALEAGAPALTGPTLHRIVGRPVAAEAGFQYSPALREFAKRHPRWTLELLDRYAADPEALVPATSMNFHGIADANERRALIEYLERAGR